MLGTVIATFAFLAWGASLCAQTDWPTYGNDPGNQRHSSLKQINTGNVAKLQRAWTYHLTVVAPAGKAATQGELAAPAAGRGGRSGGRGGRNSEASPIVAGGILYMPSPYNRVVALEPETGKEIWHYQLPNGNPSTRGVEYWPGDANSPATIFFGTTDGHLTALNAKTGRPVPGFGNEGMVDMKAGIDNGFANGNFSLSSPPKVYRNLVI